MDCVGPDLTAWGVPADLMLSSHCMIQALYFHDMLSDYYFSR